MPQPARIEIKVKTNADRNDFFAVTKELFHRQKHGSSSTQKSGGALKNKLDEVASTTTSQQDIEKFPFFRVDRKFTDDLLDGSTTAYQLFFDKATFITRTESLPKVDTTKEDVLEHTFHENVKFLLKFLFLTTYPIEDNLSTSFDANIQQMSTAIARHSMLPDVMELFQTHHTEQFTYVTMNGEKYTVIGVTWMNDVVNHTRYNALLQDIYQYTTVKQDKIKTLTKKLKDRINSFTYEKFRPVYGLMKGAAGRIRNYVSSDDYFKYIVDETSSFYNKDDLGAQTLSEWWTQYKGNFDMSGVSFPPMDKLSPQEKENFDKHRTEFFVTQIVPAFTDFYIRYENVSLMIKQNRIQRHIRSQSFHRFVNETHFEEVMNISRDVFITQKQIEFFSNRLPSVDNLLSPSAMYLYANEYKESERSLLQKALANDTEFCEMLTKLGQFVTAKTISKVNDRDEKNPILLKLYPATSTTSSTRAYISSNVGFQTALEEYVLSGCCNVKFEEFVLDVMKSYIMKEELEAMATPTTKVVVRKPNTDWMTVDVVQKVETKEKFNAAKRYEIEVQLELIQGLLNDNVIAQIKCAFEDARLTTQYRRLMDKLDQGPYFRRNSMFSIDSFMRKVAGPAPPAVAAGPAPPVAVPKKSGGAKKRSKSKYKMGHKKKTTTLRKRRQTSFGS